MRKSYAMVGNIYSSGNDSQMRGGTVMRRMDIKMEEKEDGMVEDG